MCSELEVTRIRTVYQHYADRGFIASKWSSANPGNHAIQAERERRLLELLQSQCFLPLADKHILDLGCGTGTQLNMLLKWGARPDNLCGVDLLPIRIAAARSRFPDVTLDVANAEALPYPDATFHLVVVFTLFSSILSRRMRTNISGEIDRVLTHGGAVIWYDLRVSNPFNRRVRGFSRRRVKELFPIYPSLFQAVSLVPPLARRLGSLTDRLYPMLEALPFLRSHLLGMLRKP